MKPTNLSPMSFRFDIGDNNSKQRNLGDKPLTLMPKLLKPFDLSSWTEFLPSSPSRTKTQRIIKDMQSSIDSESSNINFSKFSTKSPGKNRVPFTYGRIGDSGMANLDPLFWHMSSGKEIKLKTPKGLKWPLFLASRTDKSQKNYSDLDFIATNPSNLAKPNMIFDENLTESDLKTSFDGADSDSEENISVIKQNVLSLRQDFNILLHELLGRKPPKGDRSIPTDLNDFAYQFGNDPIFDVSSSTSRSSQPQFHPDQYGNDLLARQYDLGPRMTRSPKFGPLYSDNTSERSTPTKSNANNQIPFTNNSSPARQLSTDSTLSKKLTSRNSTPFRHPSHNLSREMPSREMPLTRESPTREKLLTRENNQKDRPLAESYQDMGKIDLSSNISKSPQANESVAAGSESLSDPYRLPRFGVISPQYNTMQDDLSDIILHAESSISDDEVEIPHPVSDVILDEGQNGSSNPHPNSNASDITFHNSPIKNTENAEYPIIDVSDVEMDEVEFHDDVNNNVDQLYDEIDRIVSESVDARLGHSPNKSSNRNTPNKSSNRSTPNKSSNRNTPNKSSDGRISDRRISPFKTQSVYSSQSVRSRASVSSRKGRSPGRPRISPQVDEFNSNIYERNEHKSLNMYTPSRDHISSGASVQTELITPKSMKSKSAKRRINYWTEAFNSSYKVPGAHDTNSKQGRSSIDWDEDTESVKRNNRYPQRLRIPMLQHWNAEPADPIDMTVQNVIKYSLNYIPSYKKKLKISRGPKFGHGRALLHISAQPRKRGRPRKYPIVDSNTIADKQTELEITNDKSYIKPGYVALLTLGGKRICYKAVYNIKDDTPDDIDGVMVYPIVMTSVCRTSLLMFPSGGNINFGESNEIFLCGYISNGNSIQIQTVHENQEINLNLKTSDTFYIPPNTPCHIYNRDLNDGAQVILIFINDSKPNEN